MSCLDLQFGSVMHLALGVGVVVQHGWSRTTYTVRQVLRS
jgi:hypothetical protein